MIEREIDRACHHRGERDAVQVRMILQIPIALYAWGHPRTLWPRDQGNPLLAHLGIFGRAYEAWLPPVHFGSGASILFPASVVVLFNVLLFAAARSLKQREPVAIS